MTETPGPAPDAERETQPYQPPQPFLREHKRAPMVSRDGLQAWLGDEIAWLESIDRTEHGDGALAALKGVAKETADVPDHTTLTTQAERAEAERDAAITNSETWQGIAEANAAELARLRAENAGFPHWELMSALSGERIDVPVRLFNADWIDEDFNPSGSIEGYWQDDEGWIGAVWNAEQDCWDRTVVNPTHIQRLPKPPRAAFSSEQAAAGERG